MEKMSQLFANCAWNIAYQIIGDDVSYAFDEKGSTLYIYFQGSHEDRDWFENFNFPRKPYKDMAIPYKVHGGFLKCWKQIEDFIIEKITTRDQDGLYKYDEIITVGYSHGAALACLCHECVWFHRHDSASIHSFAFESPRVYGGRKVKPELKERWETLTVTRTGNDIVTHVPPRLFGFCHVGKLLCIGENNKKNPIKNHMPLTVYGALLEYESK